MREFSSAKARVLDQGGIGAETSSPKAREHTDDLCAEISSPSNGVPKPSIAQLEVWKLVRSAITHSGIPI